MAEMRTVYATQITGNVVSHVAEDLMAIQSQGLDAAASAATNMTSLGF